MLLLFLFSAGIVNGFVRNKNNGEVLAYTNVLIEGTSLGASTNENGYYIIQNIPDGKYTLRFDYIGFNSLRQVIVIKSNKLRLDVELSPSTVKIRGITITASRERFEKTAEISRIVFTNKDIELLPQFFEADIMKMVQLMPGVVTMHDLSNKLYIRGGSPDENLVLLDGITVYNPSTHIFGLFSTFNPDIVKNVEIYTGGFPARFGDRLSSAISIRTREGNSKRIETNLSLSAISSKLTIQGPLPKGSFLLSGRRTYLDFLVWLYKTVANKDVSFPYYFYDIVGKASIRPTDYDNISVSFLNGTDIIHPVVEPYNDTNKVSLNMLWGNRGISLNYKRLLKENVFFNFLSAYNTFLTDFSYNTLSEDFSFNQGIHDIHTSGNIEYNVSNDNLLRIGVERKTLSFFSRFKLNTGDTTYNEKDLTYFKPLSFFIENERGIGPLFRLNGGLRFLYLNDKIRIAPRLSVKYRFDINTNLNISIGEYYQYLTTINSQESYFSIFDFWEPVYGKKIPESRHFILGIERWLGEGAIVRIETYYKYYPYLLVPEDNPLFFSFPSDSLLPATGFSYGLDFYLKRNFGPFSGWISYSFGVTKRRVDTFLYSPRYDRRNNINIMYGYKIPKKIFLFGNGEVSIRWYFGSGLPFAVPVGYVRIIDYKDFSRFTEEYVYILKGKKDSGRYPPSHKLDVHYEKDFRLFRRKTSLFLDIINLYARKNVLFYDYKVNTDVGTYTREKISILPVPIFSMGIKIKL